MINTGVKTPTQFVAEVEKIVIRWPNGSKDDITVGDYPKLFSFKPL